MNHHDITRIVESMPIPHLKAQGIVCITLNRFGIEIQLMPETFAELYPYVVGEQFGDRIHYQVKVPGAKVVAVRMAHEIKEGDAA